MPIYEYRCKDCQQVFEEWCKHFEDGGTERTCPVCKSQAQRIMSNTTFALKGGGWYVTDYGTHKGKSEAIAAPTPAPAPEKSPACAPSGCASGACVQSGCAGGAAS